jgi:hypothetical protein
MNMRANFICALKGHKYQSVFNPYTDLCDVWDIKTAPKIRQNNLASLMEAMEGKVDSIWFGRDLGYLGGRRTGIALTDEAHLGEMERVYGALGLKRATLGMPQAERTATTVWQILRQLERPPFLWNIFPFHPYVREEQQTNRCHTREERRSCVMLLDMLLEWAPTARLVAIGNDAARGLNEAGLQHMWVRHPSYGGKADFVAGMGDFYSKKFSQLSTVDQYELM